MNKFVTPVAGGTQVAAPLMASAVRVNELIDYLNKEYIPAGLSRRPQHQEEQHSQGQGYVDGPAKGTGGIALGRAMAHEVRHLYVRNPVHAADGLGSDSARLFGKDAVTFSTADKTNIVSSITTLEGQQGTRAVAAATLPPSARSISRSKRGPSLNWKLASETKLTPNKRSRSRAKRLRGYKGCDKGEANSCISI